MLKKDVKYKDFDGNEVTKTFWFHLSKMELIDLETGGPHSLTEKLKSIMKSEDIHGAVGVIKALVLAAIGRREGDQFIKDAEATHDLTRTNAFDELVFEFATKPTTFADFVVGLVPAEFADDAKRRMDEAVATLQLPNGAVVTSQAEKVETTKNLLDMSDQELREMPLDELKVLLKEFKGNVPTNILVIAMERSSK